MEQINLNTIPGIEMYPIIHVSQGDIGRQFKINLYNDEGEVVLNGTESLSITGYKADGNVFIYNLPSVTGSELTISTEEQMTAAKGECICEISVVKGTTKIGTANFIMQVEANPSTQGPVSASALDAIDALLQLAHEDIETASSAASTATTAATNAANSASSAASSASNAASSANNASSYANTASQHATDAASSASDAASSASSASTSATNAATSETKIANMTVSAQSVPYTEEAEVVKTVVGDVYNLDFKIPKGQPMSGHEVIANPSGAATGGNLTKLGIDGVNYEVSGGSGSTVTVTQIQSSGTKIAEIDVDGNTTDLYAPEGGGSEVIANPSGASTGGDLTKIGINGVNYDLAGGSEVIANPSEASTGGDLTKLGIDGVVYNLASGGGSEVIANPIGASTDRDLTKIGIDGVNYNLAPVICPLSAKSLLQLHVIGVLDPNGNVIYDVKNTGLNNYTDITVTDSGSYTFIFGKWKLNWSAGRNDRGPFEQVVRFNCHLNNTQNRTVLEIASAGSVNHIYNELGMNIYTASVETIPVIPRYTKISQEKANGDLLTFNGNPLDIFNPSVKYYYDNYTKGSATYGPLQIEYRQTYTLTVNSGQSNILHIPKANPFVMSVDPLNVQTYISEDMGDSEANLTSWPDFNPN